MLRHFGIRKRFGAGANEIATQFNSGKPSRLAASRDNDVFGFELECPLVTGDENRSGSLDPRHAIVTRDFIFLEERFDTFRKRSNDLFLAFQHCHKVELQIACRDAMGAEFLARFPKMLARFEQRFAGNAANPQARPAEYRFLVHARDVESKLSRADRCGITPRPRPDHHQVMFLYSHVKTPGRRGQSCTFAGGSAGRSKVRTDLAPVFLCSTLPHTPKSARQL